MIRVSYQKFIEFERDYERQRSELKHPLRYGQMFWNLFGDAPSKPGVKLSDDVRIELYYTNDRGSAMAIIERNDLIDYESGWNDNHD